MKDILEFDSVYKAVNPSFTISDIYLRCETGDIIGIFGRNGAGKSLLMKILFGTEHANYKFIRINNKVIKTPYQKENLIAYLPQESFLPGNIRVEKILKLYLPKIHREIWNRDGILNKVLLQKTHELSAGERRYLECMLLLKSDSKFVLLDEPLSFLSPIIKEKIMSVISEASQNKGIIVTDHDYHHLKTIVNKTYLMDKGSLQQINNEAELVFWNYLPGKV